MNWNIKLILNDWFKININTYRELNKCRLWNYSIIFKNKKKNTVLRRYVKNKKKLLKKWNKYKV